MEPNLKLALIVAASAIGGGIITAVIAPHVAWGIERKKGKLAYRKKLVEEWREMVNWAVFEYEHRVEGDDSPFVRVLERRKEFSSIKPHLSKGTIDKIHEAKIETGIHVVQTGSTTRINPPDFLASAIVNEISRIEKEWDLV